MQTIGFIGVGVMGRSMVKNLLKAGHEVIAYDILKENVAKAVEMGAAGAKSSRDVAEQCSLIITMLPNSPHVKAVIMGKDGVLEGAKEGTILIDMSSIAPWLRKKSARNAKRKKLK